MLSTVLRPRLDRTFPKADEWWEDPLTNKTQPLHPRLSRDEFIARDIDDDDLIAFDDEENGSRHNRAAVYSSPSRKRGCSFKRTCQEW